MKDWEFDAIVSMMLTSEDEVQIETNAMEAYITDQAARIDIDVDRTLDAAAKRDEVEKLHRNRWTRTYPVNEDNSFDEGMF